MYTDSRFKNFLETFNSEEDKQNLAHIAEMLEVWGIDTVRSAIISYLSGVQDRTEIVVENEISTVLDGTPQNFKQRVLQFIQGL